MHTNGTVIASEILFTDASLGPRGTRCAVNICTMVVKMISVVILQLNVTTVLSGSPSGSSWQLQEATGGINLLGEVIDPAEGAGSRQEHGPGFPLPLCTDEFEQLWE